MFKKIYSVTVLLLIGTLPMQALAETVYVNDTLRVGVRSEPNSSVAPHAVVITGMRLEVLAHTSGYIKIHSDNGVEGWIKDIYVTADMPAKLQLTALQEEQRQLKDKLASQDRQIARDNDQVKSMTLEIQKLKDENTRLRSNVTTVQKARENNAGYNYLAYSIALLILGVAGFVAGALWHRKRAMQRLGGFRV